MKFSRRSQRWIVLSSATLGALGLIYTSTSNAQDNPGDAPPAPAELAKANLATPPTQPPGDSLDATTPPKSAGIVLSAASPGIAEIVKLAQSSVSEDVMITYVTNSGFKFNPSVDEILYLTDLGVSDRVITSLLQHKPGTTGAPSQASPPPVAPAAPILATPPVNSTEPTSYNVIAPAGGTPPAVEVVEDVPPAEQAATVQYFYSSLSPYGSWVEVPSHGWCWRPTAAQVNTSWRPYGDRGRWVYTDSGWYWQSDYSWGWAPFHYGRWVLDSRCGWVWTPDRVWGPAWVSWRNHDNYCGWAPLPPSARFTAGVGFSFHSSHVGIGFDFGLTEVSYTFVPMHRFVDRYPARYALPAHESVAVYRNSTVVNNYIVNRNNNTIINEGVGRERVAAATHSPVQKISLRDTASVPTPTSKSDRIERNGSSLAVFRPQLHTTAPVTTERAGSRAQRADPATAALIARNQEIKMQGLPTAPARSTISATPNVRSAAPAIHLDANANVSATAPVRVPSSPNPVHATPRLTPIPTAPPRRDAPFQRPGNEALNGAVPTAPSLQTRVAQNVTPQPPAQPRVEQANPRVQVSPAPSAQNWPGANVSAPAAQPRYTTVPTPNPRSEAFPNRAQNNPYSPPAAARPEAPAYRAPAAAPSYSAPVTHAPPAAAPAPAPAAPPAAASRGQDSRPDRPDRNSKNGRDN